jgi:hypothetical protein
MTFEGEKSLSAQLLIFSGVRSPGKVSEPYNNPFWDFSKGGKKEKYLK